MAMFGGIGDKEQEEDDVFSCILRQLSTVVSSLEYISLDVRVMFVSRRPADLVKRDQHV